MIKNLIAKPKVNKYIKNLPDDITEDEIAYHIYVRDEIRIAREKSKEINTITHEEMKEKYKRWLQ